MRNVICRSNRSRREFVSSLGAALTTGCLAPLTAMAKTAQHADPDLLALTETFDGHVLLPNDHNYERFRRVQSHNSHTDKHPSIIARCKNAADVSRAIRFATDHELEIAVRGGGHDVMGQSTTDGGLLIDMGSMQDISVASDARTVRVSAGVRAAYLNNALQERGMAVPLGCHPNVGVTGLTLGGGLGWLLGKHGATCDSVSAFEVITADGRTLRATAAEQADLFWALRGGGGNFGVVTAVEYTPVPVGEVVRGFVIYDGTLLADFLHFYHEYMQQIPDELSVEVVVATALKPLITITFCYAAEPRHAAAITAPLLRFGPPLASNVATVPYARLADPPQDLVRQFFGTQDQRSSAASEGSGFNYWQGASLSDWTSDTIDVFYQSFLEAPPGYSIGIGHYIHGEICRVDDNATPIIRRPGSYSYFFNTDWSTPQAAQHAMNWVDESLHNMTRFSDPTYVNYLSTIEPAQVARTYGPNYAKLREIKAVYDPGNLFHLNRNILPL